MPWEVVLLDEVADWYEALAANDPRTAELIGAAFDLLEEYGPSLGRPLVDRV